MHALRVGRTTKRSLFGLWMITWVVCWLTGTDVAIFQLPSSHIFPVLLAILATRESPVTSSTRVLGFLAVHVLLLLPCWFSRAPFAPLPLFIMVLVLVPLEPAPPFATPAFGSAAMVLVSFRGAPVVVPLSTAFGGGFGTAAAAGAA